MEEIVGKMAVKAWRLMEKARRERERQRGEEEV